jgi:pimeloyl-ACP methyl ester carboxylesterase
MPQLLLLPGLACNAVMWQHQLAVIPPVFNATVTDVHTRFDTVHEMAASLLSEQTGDLILCGASMGGMLAMEVARQAAPGRIRGLALLGTNARPETPEMRQLREAAIVFFEQGRADEVLKFNLTMAFHKSRANDTALLRTYLDFVMAAGAQQLIQQNRAVMARPDARTYLPHVACPTLVLCGDSDQLTPPECSREIAALIPGAELKIIADCGHMLTMERPLEANAALLAWLGSIE